MKYESMKNENYIKIKTKKEKPIKFYLIFQFKNNKNSNLYPKLPNTILAICLIGNFYFFFFRMKVHRNGNATDVIKSISQIDNSNKQC